MDLSTRLHKGTVADLCRTAKDVRKASQTQSSIMFPPLGDISTWKIILFTDAAFANLNKVGSAAGHVIFIMGQDGKCCPISWRANKIRRVVVSTMAAEALALQEGIGDAIYTKKLLESIVDENANIPIYAFCDHKGLVTSLHSTCLCNDKLLRLNIGAIKRFLEDGQISSITHISGEKQLANCLTKVGASGLHLLKVIQSGFLRGII